MSLEKRNNGYCVRWRDSAGRQRSKQVTLYRDAVRLDGEMKRMKAMGELITHERGKAAVCDFWEVWLERYGRVHLTSRTLENYSQLWRVHIGPTFGSRQLRSLTSEDVATLISKLNQRMAPASTRKAIAVLQCVLQRAVEWDYINTNPVQGVRKPRMASREGIALSANQLAALLSELPNPRDRTVAAVLVGTGLRPGELRGLTTRAWSAQAVHVFQAVSNNELGPTKTNRQRVVVPRDTAVKAMQEWLLASGLTNARGDELLFPSAANPNRPWTDQGWRMWQRQVFAPAAKRAGLRKLVPYDLRHTFASTLIAEGRDIYWIARQMGHSPMMTLTIYGHLFESSYSKMSLSELQQEAL